MGRKGDEGKPGDRGEGAEKVPVKKPTILSVEAVRYKKKGLDRKRNNTPDKKVGRREWVFRWKTKGSGKHLGFKITTPGGGGKQVQSDKEL